MIFYVLDFIGLVEKTQAVQIDVDGLFLGKWRKNMNRPDQYGQRRALDLPGSNVP